MRLAPYEKHSWLNDPQENEKIPQQFLSHWPGAHIRYLRNTPDSLTHHLQLFAAPEILEWQDGFFFSFDIFLV